MGCALRRRGRPQGGREPPVGPALTAGHGRLGKWVRSIGNGRHRSIPRISSALAAKFLFSDKVFNSFRGATFLAIMLIWISATTLFA